MAALPEFDTVETDSGNLPDFGSALPDFGGSELPDFGESSPVQPPAFESPLSIGDQGPVWSGVKPEVPPESAPAAGAARGFFEAGGRLSKAAAALSEMLPLTAPGVSIPMTDLERKRMERTPAQLAQDIQKNPLYKAGQVAQDFPDQYLPLTEAEKKSQGTQIPEQITGMAGYVAAGPMAPAVIGMEAFTDHIVNDYNDLKKKGLSDDEAGSRAMNKALASGGIQAAVFAALPPALRKAGDKFLIEKFGQSALAQFFARRAAQTGETAGVMGASKAGENIVSGRPVTEGLGAATAAGGVLGLVTPRGGPEVRPPSSEVFTGELDPNMRRANVTTDRLALPPAPTEALPAPAERLALTEGTPEAPVAPQAAPTVPARTIPLPDAAAPAVAPAAAPVAPGADANVKAQAAVNRAVTTEGVTSGKEAKSAWIDELNKAIAEARSEDKFPGVKAERANMSKPRYIPDQALWDKAKKEIGTVTIDIPGDGKTTILNTKEALQAVLDKAKRISTKANEPTRIKRQGTSSEDKAWVQEQLANPQPITPEPKPAAPGKGKGLAGEVRRRLDAGENPGGEAGGGVPIGDLIHEFGKTVWKKGMAFAEWSKRMISELGDKAKAWLETTWNRLTVSARDLTKMTPEEVVAWKKKAKYDEALSEKMSRAVDPQDIPALEAERSRLQEEYMKLVRAAEKAGDAYSKAREAGNEAEMARLRPLAEKAMNAMQAAGPIQLKQQTLNEMLKDAPKPTASYIPNQVEAGAGIQIPQAITDTLKKTRDTIKTLAQTKGVRAVMAYTKDVAGNVATVYGQRVGNNVRGELKRAMGRDNTPNVLDENALTFVREADGDRGQLAVMRGKLTASTVASPKWKAAALKAIDHAETNWDRLNPIASQYERATDAQVAAENAAGINTLSRRGYVMHAQDIENDFGYFSDVAGEGTTGFKHARAHATYADSIAAGVPPKSINAVALLTQRVARGQMLINNRMWVEGLKTTVDPKTRKTVVTEPEIVPRGTGLPPDVRAPTDYVTEIAGGRPIAILKPYAGIFRALTEPSKFSESLGWNMALKAAANGKAIDLLIDTFHLGRISFWESIIKPLSFTDPKLPLPSYKRGVLTLDYSRAELQRMAASGEINPKHLTSILDAQRNVNGLVKHGYNVAKISDSLHQEWIQQIPIAGRVNKFIFQLFQRGAMAEVGSLEVGRYRRMHPSWSDAQVYREVAKDLNTRFGNLGRQGWFKSKTAQDTARLLALAPQWNEGLIKSEVGAVTGTLKGIGSSVKERRLSFGILPRAIGAMLLGQFVANQIINYITRGKPTWENEEEGIGAKISAWVPDVIGNGPGFFLHPAGLAAEVTHLLTQNYAKKGDLREALMSWIGGRYSTLARPLATFMTRHDVFGKLIRPENIWKETAKSAFPTPIGASAAVPAIKQVITGEKKETFPGQYQKQIMASGGIKTDQAPSPGQRIQSLAANFRKAKGITESGEFYESAYVPLRQALQRGAVKEAKQAYDDLIQKDYKEGQIAAAIRPWTGGNVLKNGRVTPSNPKPFSGSSKHEAEFLDTLTPEQLKTAEAAYTERVRIFRVFQDMLE